ncbi:MAG: DUF86 domain-containing protein [Deltaproteobacteria bacterium]|nr:DUF86 domain-containing protein [Deltaproteobacteria bacterium]
MLAEAKVITEPTAEIMKKMAAFRNLIMHLYEKIDVVEVYNIYANHLSDFDTISKELLGYLKK